MNNINFREFLVAYTECALWSSTDINNDEPLDNGEYELSFRSLLIFARDCKQFINYASDELNLVDYNSSGYTNSELAGHDFWLTRNGHGAGFWDRGLGDLGDKLTTKAESFSSVGLYIGDDGLLYC